MATTKKKTRKYPCRDLYSKVLEARLGCRCLAELPFHPVRKWRFDYAFPEEMVAVEIDGGLFMRDHAGRHSGGINQKRDFEKTNAAAEMGWLVFHYLPEQKMLTSTFMQLHNILKTRKKGNESN